MSEAQRRAKVAEEKLYGALIEAIERSRKNPIAKSIVFKMFFLHRSIEQLKNSLIVLSTSIDSLQNIVPNFTISQANFLIKTYNDIIYDIHTNFRRRDATVNGFSDFDEIEAPTYEDVANIAYMMEIALAQATSYLIRWM